MNKNEQKVNEEEGIRTTVRATGKIQKRKNERRLSSCKKHSTYITDDHIVTITGYGHIRTNEVERMEKKGN